MVHLIEHQKLIDELNTLENYSPQERLNHAKTRRHGQLEAYYERENNPDSFPYTKASHNKNIRFDKNIELIEAAARNDAEEVVSFMNVKWSPNLQNEDGLSALHQAVIEDCEDVVDVLVQHGADLNIKDADLWTPLHAAVACGNYELVKYLVDNGASLVEINTDGNMPIDLVEDNEDVEIFLDEAMAKAGYTEEDLENIRNEIPNQMLEDLKDGVQNKRDLNIVGEHGETAMHIAAANGYEEVVNYLLDHGARIDVIDHDCWQPIHAAACWGQDKIIEILVNHGADLDAVTKDGETPIDLTEDEELQGMIIELKESGHKTKELKRSQSNSSRTLSVRRSSIVEKHKISLNDAKQEGIFRQNPEFLHVVIKTDDDVDDEEGKQKVSSSALKTFSGHTEPPTPEEKNQTKIEISPHSKSTNADQAVSYRKIEEKITIESDRSAASSKNTSPQVNRSPPLAEVDDNDTEHKNNGLETKTNNIDVEKGEVHTSHNTAAKNHKTLNESTDMSVKKKCCVIL